MEENFGLWDSLWRGTGIWILAALYPLLLPLTHFGYEMAYFSKKIFSRRNLDDAIALAISGPMSFYVFLTRRDRNDI